MDRNTFPGMLPHGTYAACNSTSAEVRFQPMSKKQAQSRGPAC
jgi:hypothetical protein